MSSSPPLSVPPPAAAFAPLQRLQDQIRAAAETRRPLRICGGGSKDFLGGPLLGEPLATRELAGIVSYEPSELYIQARAGTPLAEIEAALAERGQHLAFEPPRLGGGAKATIGGVVAAGLSGPARWQAGAVRDHVLGVGLVNGRAEVLRFGGQVMKNVAGFDVSRLLAGSMGTLGLITDVTLKVMPQPAATATLRFDCDEANSIVLANEWAAAALPVDASAWWDGTLVLRLRGAAAAVNAAVRLLGTERGGELIAAPFADPFWLGLRDQQDEFFTKAKAAVQAGGAHGVALWRVSVPATAPSLGLPGEQLIEWGGALRWACTAVAPAQVRERAAALGGHALLYAGPVALREAGWGVAPLQPVLARVHRELKQAFDPAGIFNPGRWFDDGSRA